MSIPEKIKPLIGKEFQINGHYRKLIDYSIGDTIDLLFDGDFTRKLTRDNFDQWLSDAIVKKPDENNSMAVTVKNNPVDGESSLINGEVYQQTAGLAQQLTDVLIKNIHNVEKDARYIAQAKEVNRNVNSIIAIEKAKIEMLKTLKK